MNYLKITRIFLIGTGLILLAACASKPSLSDADLQRNVEIAVSSASDLPPQLQVEVIDGIVRVSGSLLCETCGGNATPGRVGTIQQSIGAVIRAVPGVKRIEFFLDSA